MNGSERRSPLRRRGRGLRRRVSSGAPALRLVPPLVLVALVLSGCAAASDPTAVRSPTTHSSPSRVPSPSSNGGTSPAPSPAGDRVSSGPPSSDAELRYLTDVQQLSTTLASASPRAVLQLGRTACAAFEQGRSVDDVVKILARDPDAAGLSGREAAVLLGASVAELCPQYRGRLSSG